MKQDLLRLEANGTPIRVAVSGAGWIGSGFVAQVGRIPGMKVNLLADADPALAREALVRGGARSDHVVEASNVAAAMDALRSGKLVVTADHTLAASVEGIDIVADLTSSPSLGAEIAYACIQHGKSIVLVNIEADVTVGHILAKLAREAGVVYSVSSGDEPGCLAELWEYVTTLGLEPVVIGKGKNNPLNPVATPDTVAEVARTENKNPFQVASYVDGTKTMLEMACAANATGCRPFRRGMIGPQATRDNVSQIFALEEDGGISKFAGAVDFVQGPSMAGGVFITTRVEDKRIANDLAYLKVGSGKYFTFFRPHHLWFLEAPLSVAHVHLHRRPWLVPLEKQIADVMTVAKRALRPGQRLDDFGGYTFYGVIDTAAETRCAKALPVGLAPGAEIIRPVSAGEVVGWADVKLDESRLVVQLRRRQDALPL